MFDKLAIVDVETSGMRATQDRIIEIGLVLIDQDKISKQWTSLVNPQTGVNPYILSMTGINPYELTQAPTFAQIEDKIWQDLQGRTLVAHNARFDYGFLKSEFNHLNKSLQLPQLCTVRLSRTLFPRHKGHGLDKIISRFNYAIENRHRALDDALIVWKFLKTSQQLCKPATLQTTIEAIVRKPALPAQLEIQVLQSLPECPGVYLFYDDKKTLLYIGKSIDIKARVKSHFYDDLRSHKELQLKKQVSRIETITTAGELDALILEAKLIKQLQPIFNHQLRRYRTLHTLTIHENNQGYAQFAYKASQHFDTHDISQKMALFKTKRNLNKAVDETATKHSLCKKLMGLEKTSSSCFGYRLKTCLGACVGKEPVESYNARVRAAFEDLCIPYWPFPGAIGIQETNPVTGQNATLVFDHWCYLGKVQDDSSSIDQPELIFDYDTYKILNLYLKKHNQHIIQFPMSQT